VLDEVSTELGLTDPLLKYLMYGLAVGLDLPDHEFDDFTEGFAVGYKLLSFQAAESGTTIPPLWQPNETKTASPVETFLTQLQLNFADCTIDEYRFDRLEDLEEDNIGFIDGLRSYAGIMEDPALASSEAFLLGAVLVHDILGQRTQRQDMLENYRRAVN
jgi:hypothetical protein